MKITSGQTFILLVITVALVALVTARTPSPEATARKAHAQALRATATPLKPLVQ